MKTVIIGSGMAGLTAGAYLAHAGHAVTIYEQFPEPGGVTATLHEKGFAWDLGPLLLEGFCPGDRGNLILQELGVADRLQAVHEDRGLAFPDFSLWKPAEYQGRLWRLDRLSQLFPQESASLKRYYKFYDQVIHLFSLAKQAERAKGLKALLYKARLWLTFFPLNNKAEWTADRLMDTYFKQRELKALFIAILADFVTKPSEFPALGVPTLHLETAFDKRIPALPNTQSAEYGYSYIIGGVGKLVQAVLGALKESGGTVHTGTAVKQIVVEDNQVKGVVLDNGSFDSADVIIASGGARETFFNLVGKDHLPESFVEDIEAIKWMESVLMVHLGINFDPTPHQPAALCYYYNTVDFEDSIERVRKGVYHEGKEGFLIYVPSMHSPEMAPAGCHAVTIYTVAPDTLAHGSWAERREELADKLITVAERIIPGLHQGTITKVILTPEDFRQRTHLEHHSFGGIPPIISNKLPPHRTPVDGLWFIGAQSESRGGVAGVMMGAEKVAKKLIAKS